MTTLLGRVKPTLSAQYVHRSASRSRRDLLALVALRTGVVVFGLVLLGLPMFGDHGTRAAEQSATSSPDAPESILARERLVAWCIVPFDAQQRTAEPRAEMLHRLGLQRVAYDWREVHVPLFEDEIKAYQKHGLEYFAFWTEHPRAFELFRQYRLSPQIWMINPSPVAAQSATEIPQLDEAAQEQAVQRAVAELLPAVERALALGSSFGLYNHGGWGGEPANLVAVCRALRQAVGTQATPEEKIGIVYNFHHAHHRISSFAEDMQVMLPYLICVNINGMNDGAQPKILPVGRGQHEFRMLDELLASGYRGPVGIINHREDVDAEIGLRENLAGIDQYLQSRSSR